MARKIHVSYEDDTNNENESSNSFMLVIILCIICFLAGVAAGGRFSDLFDTVPIVGNAMEFLTNRNNDIEKLKQENISLQEQLEKLKIENEKYKQAIQELSQ